MKSKVQMAELHIPNDSIRFILLDTALVANHP